MYANEEEDEGEKEDEFSLSSEIMYDPAHVTCFKETLQVLPMCKFTHLKSDITWIRHRRNHRLVRIWAPCCKGKWLTACEKSLLEHDSLRCVRHASYFKSGNSWHLIAIIIYPIHFRGVSQAIPRTAIQVTTNIFLIVKSVFIICAPLGTNFPHSITALRDKLPLYRKRMKLLTLRHDT
jgi:hypothetical protein